eukprot:CAMPEP_0114520138 /NCGR_PEP_ID=MMETSP0109-20121206/19404_1 /TAXON_ID=29199 /ORGANISM="Chlorarachnion reptans, Strain CCCM449" /LENGTH=88 /DNA_ID=CAMNT_0001700979 /DNA_START=196 /DNA_END=459 /DNA_ORIENTATION=-
MSSKKAFEAASRESEGTQDYAKMFLRGILQPHKKHYGGMGVARPSVWISFGDPQVDERFGQIFGQHVEGFGGKSFKKKTRGKDPNMLW